MLDVSLLQKAIYALSPVDQSWPFHVEDDQEPSEHVHGSITQEQSLPAEVITIPSDEEERLARRAGRIPTSAQWMSYQGHNIP